MVVKGEPHYILIKENLVFLPGLEFDKLKRSI